MWIIQDDNVGETPQWRQDAWAGDPSHSAPSGSVEVVDISVGDGWRVID